MEWRQINIRFTDRHAAEAATCTHLGPALNAAERDRTVQSWFFMRKADWRIRYRPAPGAAVEADVAVQRALTTMRNEGIVTRWANIIYEPETYVFGGEQAMDIAHGLFHQDSSHILGYLAQPDPRQRRELSVLLCVALMRSNGLDWYEQGDVWARIARNRPTTNTPEPQHFQRLTASIGQLLEADTSTGISTADRTFADHAATWLDAFTRAGVRLSRIWSDGALTTGIRAITAHHVLFHWNRLGIPYETQGLLASAARDAVFT
ncbi:thiopeptide-type bacteriocin biosynthesis protein [Kitasatospora sp. NPDC028055]|uniref:thiopeptide-type bacteriocin biosynthesis protein n=1 Tax=Kitasatospora sp. NPDC028055 TaxID=3155653 RepID=UPI0033C2AB46